MKRRSRWFDGRVREVSGVAESVRRRMERTVGPTATMGRRPRRCDTRWNAQGERRWEEGTLERCEGV
jgi:hypothetical protein